MDSRAERPAPAAVEQRPCPRRRWLALALAPLVSLVLGELLVRSGAVGPPPRPRIEGGIYAPLEAPYFYENAPSATRVSVLRETRGSPARRIVQATNAQRLRGPVVAVPKPPGTLRIACVGDSHTFGDGVADDATWPAVFELGLRAAHPQQRIEVLNAGVLGYDSAQEARWTVERVLPLEPDAVILQFFINDVSPRDALGDQTDMDFWTRISHPQRPGKLAVLRQYSALLDATLETLFRRKHLERFAAINSSRFDADSEGWQRCKIALVQLSRTLEKRGVAFVVALYPLLLKQGEGLASDAAFATLRTTLEVQGITCFDLTPAFLNRPLEPLRLVPGDLHAGAPGHRLFAEALLTRCTTSGWLGQVSTAASGAPQAPR